MQHLGASKAAVDQHARYQVRTGFGDSAIYYGGDKWLIPMVLDRVMEQALPYGP
jgi:hypothetical protein